MPAILWEEKLLVRVLHLREQLLGNAVVRHHIGTAVDDERRDVVVRDALLHPLARHEGKLESGCEPRLGLGRDPAVERVDLVEVFLHLWVSVAQGPEVLARGDGPHGQHLHEDMLEELHDNPRREHIPGDEQHGAHQHRAVEQLAFAHEQSEKHAAAHGFPEAENLGAAPSPPRQWLHVFCHHLPALVRERQPVWNVNREPIAAAVPWQVEADRCERSHAAQNFCLQGHLQIAMVTEAMEQNDHPLDVA
mmetsp:Transcript_88716/g.271671  ORF Transcript_88716/g.271671 Transcript_88716/m.271671 type:complete len:249 (-) Transcript_88716:410-1156(-)